MEELRLNAKGLMENDLTIGEALFILMFSNNVDLDEVKKSLLAKGFIGETLDTETYKKVGFFLTRKGADAFNNAIQDSDPVINTMSIKDRIEELVPQLQAIYPEGKNFNNQYWKGNKTDIKRRLQTFFKKYGDEYTNEQIIEATETYVRGFNGDYKFMRLLQYFIWKEEIKDGTKIVVSILADHIENAGQENSLNDFSWTNMLN